MILCSTPSRAGGLPDAPRLYRQGTKAANRHATMHSVLLVSVPSPALLQTKKFKEYVKIIGKIFMETAAIYLRKKKRKKNRLCMFRKDEQREA